MSKKKNRFLCWPAAALFAFAVHIDARTAAAQGVEKTSNGMVLQTDQGYLSVTVRSENVIHVMAAKDRYFFTHASLSALRAMEPPKWELTTDEHSTTISTAHMKAVVDLKSGAIRFQDSKGRPILAEKSDGRTLEPAEVQGEKTFHVRQQWQADAEESLYGLGQFQLGLVDIKNWDLDLWQRNGTVISRDKPMGFVFGNRPMATVQYMGDQIMIKP